MASETRQGRHSRSPVGVRKLLVLVLAGLLLWRGEMTGLVSGGAGNAGAVCYTLTLNVGSGSGSVLAMPGNSGSCPSGQYTAGFTVALLATASPGYQWSSWSGADNDSVNSTNVTMTGDRTATAYFTSNCYRLTLTVGGGNGSVLALPSSAGGCPAGQYPGGFTVAVIATAGPGYQWSSWSGTDNDSISSTSVTMTSDRTATASFTWNCYRLTLTVGGGNGSVLAMPGNSGSCPSGQYTAGFTVAVIATAGPGYQWSSWSGTDNDSIRSTSVTMTSDRTATAYFVLQGGTAPPTPVPTATPTPTPTPTWPPTPTSMPTPTSTPPDPGTPTAAPPPGSKTDTPAPTPTFTPSPTASGLRGDADCDGRVTAIDVALVLQLGAGLVAHVACQQAADVNGDGRVNAVDAALILQFVAGLVSGF